MIHMTEGEICRRYRHSKDKAGQIQILAELNCTDRAEITRILIQNGERVRIPIPTRGKPRKNEMADEEYYAALFRRLDILNAEIVKRENEYREIMAVLEGEGKRIEGYERR